MKRPTAKAAYCPATAIPAMKNHISRGLIEVAFIMLLFYANLLMGEYMRSGQGFARGFVWALGNILTPANFGIGIAAALVGYVVVEYLRRYLK
jgi:hypothetical protein